MLINTNIHVATDNYFSADMFMNVGIKRKNTKK